MVVFLLTTPSVKAARAVTSLMVEQGTNPVLSASLWLTILRMRPLPICIDGGILADHAFGQGGEGGDEFDGGTGNEPGFERQPLVDHTEDASAGGVDHDDAAGKGSQGGDGGAADDEIVAIDVIAHGGVDAGDFGLVGEFFLFFLSCRAA